MCDGLVVEDVAGGEGDLVAALQQPRDEAGEGEGDGLGDAGEVDQDRGAHHCSLIDLYWDKKCVKRKLVARVLFVWSPHKCLHMSLY